MARKSSRQIKLANLFFSDAPDPLAHSDLPALSHVSHSSLARPHVLDGQEFNESANGCVTTHGRIR